jgi:hypothetical protein
MTNLLSPGDPVRSPDSGKCLLGVRKDDLLQMRESNEGTRELLPPFRNPCLRMKKQLYPEAVGQRKTNDARIVARFPSPYRNEGQ